MLYVLTIKYGIENSIYIYKTQKILTIQLSVILYFRYQTNIIVLYYLIYIIIKNNMYYHVKFYMIYVL